MPVYEHGYRSYTGPLNPASNRFLVLARYGFANVFRSRLFIAFYVGCFSMPLVATVILYLHYNVEALDTLGLPISDLIKIDTFFFRNVFFLPQTVFAFFLILFQGPSLVSPDLRNNALPLYLSRPLNKTDYVLGKFVVLAALTSSFTWIPGLLLFFLESYLQGGRWMLDHLSIATGIFFGSWVWITVLSLFALAVSAWVKWKPWAAIAFLGSILICSAVGTMFRFVLPSWWGSMLILNDVAERVWDQLFGVESSLEIPAFAAWFALAAFAGFSILALYRRIRAYEVVS
jgi:hypothetical protein